MMAIGLVLLSCALALLANCVMAWSLSVLWDWFCQASLGQGPSIGAWFGISCIAGLILFSHTFNLQREETKKGDSWGKPVSAILTCFVVLGFSWCIGTLFNWKG